jgi:hypothetical protein
VAEQRNEAAVFEAVIDQDGNGVIPADQLPSRLPAGTHLRVHLDRVGGRGGSVEGMLPGLPEITWDQFESASRLVAGDTEVDHDRRS